MTPIRKNKTISVSAYDIATSFDLSKLQTKVKDLGKLRDHDPIIVELAATKYLVVFDYGSVVFFNFALNEEKQWLARLKQFSIRANRRVFSDNFTLNIGDRKSRVSTNELSVNKFFLDIVKLVAIILSRSVALEYYEDLIDRNLEKLEESVDTLSREGRFIVSRRELIKQVGLANAIQHELAYNLSLLDDPEVVWERGEEMQQLYQHLSSQYAIQRRSQIISRKLEIISNSSKFIIDQLQNRIANVLEAAIVFLFVVDIIFILIDLFG
ncbi:MAG: RMD1 family protein [Patescibacteria group bacterium]